MKTTYYFTKTNAYNEVIAVRGNKGYSCPVDSQGFDTTSGVNICDQSTDETVELLKAAYGKLNAEGNLYNMDDIERDFPDDVWDFNSDNYDVLSVIAEVK